jgi:hypothetical protein
MRCALHPPGFLFIPPKRKSAKKTPFFAYFFLALAKKVRRLAGRDPPVLTDVTSPKSVTGGQVKPEMDISFFVTTSH